MTVTSAGVLLYRTDDAGVLQLWIVHMGGPFWARKDEAAWSIPKGEYVEGEDPYKAALREFDRWEVRSVRRESNERADELVNEALDVRERGAL